MITGTARLAIIIGVIILVGHTRVASGQETGTKEVAGDENVQSEDIPPVSLSRIGPMRSEPVPGIHPAVVIVDDTGKSVLASHNALSLMKSCGACHNTNYIAEHNYHALAGLDERHPPGLGPSGRQWDTSTGLFGRFDPLIYRWLTPVDSAYGERDLDLGTAEWIQVMGARHVGGGPAFYSRRGRKPLTGLSPREGTDPETHVIDSNSGIPRSWDWQESGAVELNCLLCHMKGPDNRERVKALSRGKFGWASTATLVGTSIVQRRGSDYTYNPENFDLSGAVSAGEIGIGRPRSENCRLCHGKACRCVDPVVFENSLDNWAAETTGTVFSAKRMSDSGMNIKGKEKLLSPWDVHAERLLRCADCHHSMNNPVFNAKQESTKTPPHLAFDARRLPRNDYLVEPNHDLVKGHTAQGTLARRLDGSMRGCRDCHSAEETHDFLPYKKVHFESLGCQVCHLPQVHAPARRMTDWTLLTTERKPLVMHRGVDGPINDPASLISGYLPALLMHQETDGKYRLAPHNLITSWFWVTGEPEHPVRKVDLERAFFDRRGEYHPPLMAVLDENSDGNLTADELRLDNESKVSAAATRLESVGVTKPHIKGEIQPYTIGHGMQSARYATRCCTCCHGFDSRITTKIVLTDYTVGGVLPEPVDDSLMTLNGQFKVAEGGQLVFEPAIDRELLYIHGTNHIMWLDVIGIAIIVSTTLAVGLHGLLRLIAAWRKKRRPA